MSENRSAEQLSETYEAAPSDEQGLEGTRIGNEYPAMASDSHAVSNAGHDHAIQLVEHSDGVSQLQSESATDAYQEDSTLDALESNNQIKLVDPVNGFLGAAEQGEPDDAKSVEDTAKDDMFVDCPDELTTSDGRQTDGKEEAEGGEIEEKPEENKALQHESHFVEVGNGAADGYLTDELERLRRTLVKTVAEKESIAREYQEERKTFAQGVLNLHCQLKALTYRQSLPYEAEVTQVADVPLNEIINECLELAKTSSEERLNAEATIKNLQAILSIKDQEIENLHSKITELSVSGSYSDSVQSTLEATAGVQIDKDLNIEILIDKMVSSLATAVNQEQIMDSSISGKLVHVEEGTSLLVERYNKILSEIDQLGHSFSEVGLDTKEQDYGNILVAARDGLQELKRKEAELLEKMAQLEVENRQLVEALDEERVMIGTLDAELGNVKRELEQEKVRCANTKEKLSMAVTKGKALVQQRDSLKQSLADKSNELEKCLIELQEKSVALEAAELTKEELVRSENVAASLQNSLLQSNTIIEQVEAVLSQIQPDEPKLLDVPERLRWLVDDRNMLKVAFLEFCKMKDALSLIDLPESVSSSDLEFQMNWLKDYFHKAKDDMNVLQEEVYKIKEAAHNRIDHLSGSLLLELLEKDYLQLELTDLRGKYEDIFEKNHQIQLEKDQIVKLLAELSGLNLEGEGIDQSCSSASMIINLCFQMIKEQSGPFSKSSHIDVELFERIQSLLYVRDMGLVLYEYMLEEEVLIRSEVKELTNKLKVAHEEILALKDEKGSLQKDLERSEEKSVVLRDKLSMAVKKGKGLVQDRDNLKSLINEKNLEIEQLKLELQKHESSISEYRDQINRMSIDVESIPKLESDLVSLKNERDQFERFLLESNNMLQRVIESIDGIVIPVDSVFEEPVEKVKWFVGYVNECQDAKLHADQELQLAKEGISVLESKLAKAEATVLSLEQALSSSENSISQLAEEKKELELGKAKTEEELQKVKEELAEVFVTTESLKDTLSQAEKDISVLSNEKEQAEVSRAATETELEQVKEEASRQTSKLAEASRTIKDLHVTLSQFESNFNLLTEKCNTDQVVKTNMENELKKLQDKTEDQASKLMEASATIKSMEDASSKAQDNIYALEDANKSAKEEISSLSFKLNSCLDELAGKTGSLENKSVELIGLLNDLQLLMKEDTIFPKVKQCFERKFETLKNLDLILNKINHHIVGLTAEDAERHLVLEEDLPVKRVFSDGFEDFDAEMDNRDINDTDIDNIISIFGNLVKRFQLRNKLIANKCDDFSYSMDEIISPLQGKLLKTEADLMTIFKHMETMKEKANGMDILKEEHENTVATLEKDIIILLSACTDATSELQIEVEKNLVEPACISEVEKESHGALEQAEYRQDSRYMETAQKLIEATRKAQTLFKQFELKHKEVVATIEDLHGKLRDTSAASEKAIEERDLSQNRVLQLESDIQVLHHSCNELRNNLEGYHALEEKLMEKEAELSSLSSTLSTKEQEAKNSLLSASQLGALFGKIDGIEIPIVESGEDDMEPHNSAAVKKLFYIIDSYTGLHHQINSVSRDKEELQSALTTKVLEVKHLREEVEQFKFNKNWEVSEKVKNELSELSFALEKVLHMLGASEWVGDGKLKDVKGLIPVLEKHVMAILLESETSKSKAQELGSELLGSQKVIDELTTKVKLLEDSIQDRNSKLEIVQERGVFEKTPVPAGSEISEVEEVQGSLGKKAISPVSSAAHVRNMRKGSTEHLALDIDVESDRLIGTADTDEDKGHVFKSLNASGLVPKQGKFIADRIDGIWASGGRVLMSRPRARLGLIGYLLILHIWVLGTIL